MANLDSILNVLIPILLIGVLIAFLWMKTPLGAWLGPHLHDLWLNLKGENTQHVKRDKVIVYE